VLNYEDLKQNFDEALKRAEQDLDSLRENVMNELEKCKNNEILKAIEKLNLRLNNIEKRLPELPERNEVDDG
jgi:hypothetical protein